MSDACASEAAGRRLHTEGSDQNACMHVAAARGARRRATGGASLGEGDGSADPRVSYTGARAMAGARNHWSIAVAPAAGDTREARVTAAAVDAGPGKPGPRIHDLRHTFAVRSLEQCTGGREAVARHMLAFSTYLGHARLSDTYWYLTATPRQSKAKRA